MIKPKDAQVKIDELWYKIGRNNLPFVWASGEWRKADRAGHADAKTGLSASEQTVNQIRVAIREEIRRKATKNKTGRIKEWVSSLGADK